MDREVARGLALERRVSREGFDRFVRRVRDVCPLLALVRFVATLRVPELSVSFEVRLAPLRPPSFEANASIALRGASTVFRAPLATFSGACASRAACLPPAMCLASLFAATCAMVTVPAPAAKPPAPARRAVEVPADGSSRGLPTRLIASPTAVATIARAVSVSRILRALPRISAAMPELLSLHWDRLACSTRG